MTEPARLPRAQLLRVLGVAFGVAVIVGNTIGVGILRTPGEIAARVPSPLLFLILWVVGGLYALLGALSLAELGTMIPRSGGQYVFVRRALGEYPGFVVGWSDWVSTAGSAAFIATVFAEYTAPLLPGFSGREKLLALAVLAVFTLILWQGIRIGDRAQQLTSLVKGLVLLLLAGACFVVGGLAPAPATTAIPHGFTILTAIVIALQAVIYTYDGWTGPLYFSGELRDPGREIPRAMMLGVVSVIVIYLVLNLAFLAVVPISAMAGDPFVAGTAARVLFGDSGDLVIRILVAVGMLSAVNALLLMCSRVPVAMAEDGLVAAVATRVSPEGTPTVTLLVSALVAAVFVLTGTFNAILALLAFFFVFSYAMSFTSLFVLRVREPDTPRPWRVPGYPVIPALALLGSLAFLLAGFAADRVNSLRALALLLASYPVYRVFLYFRR